MPGDSSAADVARSRAAEAFLDHFRILPRDRSQDLLWEVGEAFAHLPYENFTKLIKKHATPAGRGRRRLPGEVVSGHVERGTGGTCFALTETFRAVLDRLGYRSRPVLCDMRAGEDTHCAVWIDLPEGPHLMDPGYLLHRPLRLLPGQVQVRDSGVGEVRVTGAPGGGSYDVTTGGRLRYRMKAAPVSRARFVALWEASFDWGHMGNLHLSRASERGYAYLHGHRLRLQRPDGHENVNLRGRLAEELAARFGLAPQVVAEAQAAVEALRASAPLAQERGPERGRGRPALVESAP